jgi:predicted acylesterase/phospholipase RssA
MTKVRQSLATFTLSLALAGCSIIPLYTRANERLAADAKPTRASREIGVKDLPKEVFVGIAISGGGSRAANFSAAVLFELEELGFLRTVSAISSVSGGSLTSAYYGLFGHDPIRWNRERVKALFRKDFQTRWIFRWFLPHNIVRYWFTDFDRSDIMKGVFDDLLFEKRTFGDMPAVGPVIIINATNLTTERQFRFTDKDFKTLESRLDTYPISHAVMASGAFPGAFNNVTLQNYSTQSGRPHYVHLFDGGPADNLGVQTLLRLLRQQLYTSSEPPRACFLFVVDAYPSARGKGSVERDTRKFWDFILDENVLDASDVLLTLRREDILHEVGFKGEIGARPFQEFAIFPERPEGPRCSVWHLTFQRLVRRFWHSLPASGEEVGKIANEISTQYRLKAPRYNACQLQETLYEAARFLVREDLENRGKACDWFHEHGFTDLPCASP